jgi:hypothetical protein
MRFWRGRELWTLSEAAALLVGVDPEYEPELGTTRAKRRTGTAGQRLDSLIEANESSLNYFRDKGDALRELRDAVTLEKLDLKGPLIANFKLVPDQVVRWATSDGRWPKFPFAIVTPLQQKTPSGPRERDPLSPLIREALKLAKDPKSTEEIFQILSKWAKDGRPPMLELVEGEIKWNSNDDSPKFLGRKALADRLRRLRDRTQS